MEFCLRKYWIEARTNVSTGTGFELFSGTVKRVPEKALRVEGALSVRLLLHKKYGAIPSIYKRLQRRNKRV